MSVKTLLAGVLALVLSVLPAFAGEAINIHDAYFRTSGVAAKSGAAFMVIENEGAVDDRLISAKSDIAKKVELHTHMIGADGVAKMRAVEGGFPIAAQDVRVLERGGDHVMFMGVTRRLKDGDTITLTLTFEKAGDITLEIPVDMSR
jgi:hypothetical protein